MIFGGMESPIRKFGTKRNPASILAGFSAFYQDNFSSGNKRLLRDDGLAQLPEGLGNGNPKVAWSPSLSADWRAV